MILADCIAKVESSNNPRAIRFEGRLYREKPGWITALVPTIIKRNHLISPDTALMVACTSWGKFQMLGANIYDEDYALDIFDFVNDQIEQENIFESFIEAKGFKFNEDVSAWSNETFLSFARIYNGPGEILLYVASMKAAIK